MMICGKTGGIGEKQNVGVNVYFCHIYTRLKCQQVQQSDANYAALKWPYKSSSHAGKDFFKRRGAGTLL